MLFRDFHSCEYFEKDWNEFITIITGLEERASEGERIAYSDYRDAVGLPKIKLSDYVPVQENEDLLFQIEIIKRENYIDVIFPKSSG